MPGGSDWDWFGLRLLFIFAPVVAVVALAAAFDGRYLGAAVLGLMAVVMFTAGYRTRGQQPRP